MNEKHDLDYDEAQDVCKNVCGNLYFPSTQEENNEVENVLDNIASYKSFDNWGNFWIRLSYNETEGKWEDADNKGGFPWSSEYWTLMYVGYSKLMLY